MNPDDVTGIDPRTPVLVGIGLVSQREFNASNAREPLDLMLKACLAAQVDSGRPALFREVDLLCVPQGRWNYRDPCGALRLRLGAKKARTILSKVGVLQERVLAHACTRIAAADADVALVVGGEAGFRLLRARKTGVELRDVQQDSEPDEVWRSPGVIVSEAETATGLGVAAPGYYAIIESAARHRLGKRPLEQAAEVARAYRYLSETAAGNPQAWVTAPIAEEDMWPSDANPVIATPYTRLHCSDWSVDQASALLLVSAGRAIEEGIPTDRWVFPLASSWSDHAAVLTERVRLDDATGIEHSSRAALDAAGLAVSELDLLDIYSCYPSALRAHAEALGRPLDGAVSITGGMRFGGGPFNNYVLHAVGQLASSLRQGRGAYGAITSVSGMLTKHAIGLWGVQPPPGGYVTRDVTFSVGREMPTRLSTAEHHGPARVVGYTVLHERGTPVVAVAVLDAMNGERLIARSADPVLLRAFPGTEDQCGRIVKVDGDVFADGGTADAR